MVVSKEAHLMFQAKRFGNMYMLRNSEVTVGAVILGFKSGGCRTIGDYDEFELGCSIIPQREIGPRPTR